MLAITQSMVLQGLIGRLISVQVDVSAGMPYFEIVGLPDVSIKESKERVKTAIRNSNVEFLSRRIVVNLAPANIKKEGSILDLSIAVAIMVATQKIKNRYLKQILKDTIFVGELSLDGSIEKINGILPICIEARKIGIKRIILPKKNAIEASVIDNIDIIPVNNLYEVINYLNGKINIKKEINKRF